MDSGVRKGPSSTGSSSYRRIIPPLNDTDSDSSLEYWEERGWVQGSSSQEPFQQGAPASHKVKREPDDEEAQSQRMVYKLRPLAKSGGMQGEQEAVPASVNNSPRRHQPFMTLADVTLPEPQSQMSNRRHTAPDPRLTPRVERSPPGTRSGSEHSYSRGMTPQVASPGPSTTPPSVAAAAPSDTLEVVDDEPAAKKARMLESAAAGIDGLNSNILQMIECPVCLDYMGPPIHQCRRGHLVCSSCRAQLVNCPTCRSRFTDLRNLVLERIVEMIKYPCRHERCEQMHLLKDKSQHELNCKHRRYSCMAQGCNWRGVHSELVVHVKREHAGLIHSGNRLTVSFPLQMLANSSRNYVMHAFDEMFRVNFQRAPGPNNPGALVHGLVIYLGPIDNAANFTFTFSMEKEKDGIDRGLTFRRTVLSDEHKPCSYYAKSEAFCAPVDMLRLVATSKSKVHVDVVVERRVVKQEPLAAPLAGGSNSTQETDIIDDDGGDK